jgi:uncharacterized protein YukE
MSETILIDYMETQISIDYKILKSWKQKVKQAEELLNKLKNVINEIAEMEIEINVRQH